MGPKPPLGAGSADLYRSRLDSLLDHRHELFQLAGLIDWTGFDQAFGRFYRPLGRPAKPTRLMVGLSYLKHVFDLCTGDETAGKFLADGRTLGEGTQSGALRKRDEERP